MNGPGSRCSLYALLREGKIGKAKTCSCAGSVLSDPGKSPEELGIPQPVNECPRPFMVQNRTGHSVQPAACGNVTVLTSCLLLLLLLLI